MAVTKFEPGKYYAHPSKEHSGNWCDSMDIMLDGQPRKCIESCNSTRKNSAYNTTEQSMQIEGHRIKHAFPFDEFIEVPDWNPDEWEFIGNAEQAAGRKIEEGDERLIDGKWDKIQDCDGIDIGKYITTGKYAPVRRRKVAAPQSPAYEITVEYEGEKWRRLGQKESSIGGDKITTKGSNLLEDKHPLTLEDIHKPEELKDVSAWRKVSTPVVKLKDKFHSNCKHYFVDCTDEPCRSCLGENRKNWEPADPPARRIVNIEDAPIGAQVRIVELAKDDTYRIHPMENPVGKCGIVLGVKFSPDTVTVTIDEDRDRHINKGAKVELLDEPKEVGGTASNFWKVSPCVTLQVGGILNPFTSYAGIDFRKSEKSYAEKRRERRAKVLGFLKDEGGLE
jgi:hypothetical protein